MHFDPRAAKLLQPGNHMTIAGCKGLRLEARAAFRTWIYRYEDQAKRMKQVALGRWPDMPFPTAVAEWQRLSNVRAIGGDPQGTVKSDKPMPAATGPLTCEAVIRAHMKALESSRAASGATAGKRALERLIDEEPQFARGPASGLTRTEAFRIIDDRKAFPMATAKLKSMLAAAWDAKLDSGDIDPPVPNWWREVMKGKLQSKGKIMKGEHVGKRRPLLTPERIGRLLLWAPDNMHANGADLVALYLRTATRGSEITSMRPEHFKRESGVLWWTVPKGLTKNRNLAESVDLRVPLFGAAEAIVARRLECVGPSGYLFESGQGDEAQQYTQKRFSTYAYDLQPYSAKAERDGDGGLRLPKELSGWTPHHLRRTARTQLAALGCPNEIGEAMIGHVQKEMVATYNAYTYDAERLHWLAKLGERMDQLAAAAAEARGLPARP